MISLFKRTISRIGGKSTNPDVFNNISIIAE